jgi:hypothetical protein
MPLPVSNSTGPVWSGIVALVVAENVHQRHGVADSRYLDIKNIPTTNLNYFMFKNFDT